jgi:hypothetical protein
MAGGSLIRKIRKAFKELIALGLVEDKPSASSARRPPAARPSQHAVKQGTGTTSSRSAPTPSLARWPSAILLTALPRRR